jgi:hypothetical protein
MLLLCYNVFMRTCTSCNQTLSLDSFHKRNDRKSGYVTKCKQCSNVYKKKYRDNNKHIIRSWNKRRNPGWDVDRYDEYVKLQNNRCAICGTNEPGLRDWCADHCHTENKARGLLCVKCNAGLGYFRDNTEYLQSAINYLNKWK